MTLGMRKSQNTARVEFWKLDFQETNVLLSVIFGEGTFKCTLQIVHQNIACESSLSTSQKIH